LQKHQKWLLAHRFFIAAQSLIGFTGDISNGNSLDWNLILTFTLCSVIEFLLKLSLKFSGEKLKHWLVCSSYGNLYYF
jgi:hypothetical protein